MENLSEVHCECGEVTGVRCAWTGPREQTVVIEWMPPYLRTSHEAAGNWGAYPANGAIRLRVETECADRLQCSCDDYDSGPAAPGCYVHDHDADTEPPFARLVTDVLGFWGTDEETFLVTEKGTYLIQSPDLTTEYEQIGGLPAGVVRLPESICAELVQVAAAIGGEEVQ